MHICVYTIIRIYIYIYICIICICIYIYIYTYICYYNTMIAVIIRTRVA